MDPLNRRTFLFASSGAAAGSLLVPGLVGAEDGDTSPYAGSGLVTGKPKALRYKEVPGFLSAAQIAPHHTAHYGLALKATDPPEGVKKAVEKRFGSLDKWAADFVASAKTAAGWATLVVHPVNGRLYNVVSDEHAQGRCG